jgi:hypothetical protein
MPKDVWDMSDEELENAVSEERENINNDEATEDDNTEEVTEQSDATNEEDEVEVQDSSPENVEEDSNTEDEDATTDNDDEVEGGEEAEASADVKAYRDLVVDGENIPINDMEELYTMASAGGRVTQKFQELAEHRRTISAMQEAGLTAEDINVLIEAQKGNKDAIASIVKKSGIDPMDIDEEDGSGYVAPQYGKSDTEQAIVDIQQMISKDPEYDRTANIIDEQWDAESRNQIIQEPNIIMGLHNDIKSGLYDRVAPEAKKLAIADGMRRPQIEYYMQAGQLVSRNDSLNSGSSPEDKAIETERTAKRKSAGSNRGKRVAKKAELDFNKMSDDEAWALREQIMSRT